MLAESARVCIVVPTYNERENVLRLVEEFAKVRRGDEFVLFVDDSSPDGTSEVVSEAAARFPWVKLLVRRAKKGIGSAYREGFAYAISKWAPEVLVEIDADLQHPPGAVSALVDAVDSGADVAVGSRYVEGGSIPGWSLWRRTVSKVANAYARSMLKIPVRDATSGLKAYRQAAARLIAETDLPAKGFEFQVASLHLLKTDMKMVEVPYTFSARTAGVSKLGVKDMARFVFGVLRVAVS